MKTSIGLFDTVDVRLNRLIVLSRGFRSGSNIERLLDEFEICYGKPERVRPSDVVLAWGQRPSAFEAVRFAETHGLQILRVEDGFLRSVGLGCDDDALSIVADDLGLYLDASIPTRLESHIAFELDEVDEQRATDVIALWRDCEVSKYNHQRSYITPHESYVLVVDQTVGDASITAGMANFQSFSSMFDAALRENPKAKILVKVHPEVTTGRKKGHFDIKKLALYSNVEVVSTEAHSVSLIKNASAVYVVTSLVGFEALIWGKLVRTFGMPFYAGWGLTDDELPRPARRKTVEIQQLIYGSLIAYPRYLHPEDQRRCEIEAVIRWMGHQRKLRNRFPPVVFAYGFSKWKKPFVKEFFNGSKINFISSIHGLKPAETVAVWGRKHERVFSELRADNKFVFIEDGFLRSVGLGAHLVRPISWVLDSTGIYYDATRSSDLEIILKTERFSDALLERARLLIAQILKENLTKYNLDEAVSWSRENDSRKVILVPGQVESDASLEYGGGAIRSNIELLRLVRRSHPDAFVIYKPHPDVVARLRTVGQEEDKAGQYCDALVTNTAMHILLSAVDEVHTMTSLTGFEAILRDVKVVTYGCPFYAGWGLTRDFDISDAVLERRGRSLSVQELAAATLILYPTYISRVTGKFTSPEQAVSELVAWRQETPAIGWLQRFTGRLFRKS